MSRRRDRATIPCHNRDEELGSALSSCCFDYDGAMIHLGCVFFSGTWPDGLMAFCFSFQLFTCLCYIPRRVKMRIALDIERLFSFGAFVTLCTLCVVVES